MSQSPVNTLMDRDAVQRPISNANFYTKLYGIVIRQQTCDGTTRSVLFFILVSTNIPLCVTK